MKMADLVRLATVIFDCIMIQFQIISSDNESV